MLLATHRRAFASALAVGLALACTPVTARAHSPATDPSQSPAFVVERVDASVCFGAAELDSEVRRRVSRTTTAASVGTTLVSVATGGGGLRVTLTRRGRRADGSVEELREDRVVPASTDCAAELEAVAAIVARSVPMPGWTPSISAPGLGATTVASPSVHDADRAPADVATTRRGSGDWHLRIDAGFSWLFGVDGGGSIPAGRLDVGARFRRFVITAGAGVTGSLDEQASDATLSMRRYPCLVLVGYEPALRWGALRFGAGLLLDFWTARAESRAGLDRSVVLDAGLHAEAGYRMPLGRMLSLLVAADLDYVPARQAFVAPDTALARATPRLWLGPRVGLSLEIF